MIVVWASSFHSCFVDYETNNVAAAAVVVVVVMASSLSHRHVRALRSPIRPTSVVSLSGFGREV